MQCTRSCLIKSMTFFLLFCSCSVVAWDYEPVFRGYRGEEAHSMLRPRRIGRNLVRWGGLGYIPMRKPKKKIEIITNFKENCEFLPAYIKSKKLISCPPVLKKQSNLYWRGGWPPKTGLTVSRSSLAQIYRSELFGGYRFFHAQLRR